MNLDETIYDPDWLDKNATAIKDLLPKTWTHISNVNGLKIGFNFKVLGIDWRSELEFFKAMEALVDVGIVLREGYTIRRKI